MSRTPPPLLPVLRIAAVLSAVGLIAGYVVLAQRQANLRLSDLALVPPAVHAVHEPDEFARRELRIDDIKITVPPGLDLGPSSAPEHDVFSAVMDTRQYRRDETVISTTKSMVVGPVVDSLFMESHLFPRLSAPQPLLPSVADLLQSTPVPVPVTMPPIMAFSSKRIDVNAKVVSSAFANLAPPTPAPSPPTVMPGSKNGHLSIIPLQILESTPKPFLAPGSKSYVGGAVINELLLTPVAPTPAPSPTSPRSVTSPVVAPSSKGLSLPPGSFFGTPAPAAQK